MNESNYDWLAPVCVLMSDLLQHVSLIIRCGRSQSAVCQYSIIRTCAVSTFRFYLPSYTLSGCALYPATKIVILSTHPPFWAGFSTVPTSSTSWEERLQKLVVLFRVGRESLTWLIDTCSSKLRCLRFICVCVCVCVHLYAMFIDLETALEDKSDLSVFSISRLLQINMKNGW